MIADGQVGVTTSASVDILNASAEAEADSPLNAKAGPIIHTSRDGIKFWVDSDSFRILTDEPDTYLEEVHYGSMGGMYRRLVLNLEGHPIEFAGSDDMPYEYRLEENPAGDPPMSAFWRFSGLSTLGDHFTSRAQQDRAVRLLTDMLTNFNRGWASAQLGQKQSATVEFSQQFQDALDQGLYIRGKKS